MSTSKTTKKKNVFLQPNHGEKWVTTNTKDMDEIRFLLVKAAYIRKNDANRLKDAHEIYNKIASMFNNKYDQNDMLAAKFLYQHCLRLAEQMKDKHKAVNAMYHLGFALSATGNTYQAIQFHECQMEYARQLEDTEEKRLAANSLMNLYREYGLKKEKEEEYYDAIEFFSKCVESAMAINDRNMQCDVFKNLGIMYTKIGDVS